MSDSPQVAFTVPGIKLCLDILRSKVPSVSPLSVYLGLPQVEYVQERIPQRVITVILLIDHFDASGRVSRDLESRALRPHLPYNGPLSHSRGSRQDMKTRTKGPAKAAAEAVETTESTIAKVQLSPESSNPPQLLVLPEEITPEARIISLINPRRLSEDRYIVCPERGFYEFKLVAAPKTTPRSWLLSRPEDEVPSKSRGAPKDTDISNGYVTRAADLYIATSIDPLFFLLPALAPALKNSEHAKRLFLSSDDYFEKVASVSPHLARLIREKKFHDLLEKRLAAVCETVEAGDEAMYRLDEERLLKDVLRKAKKMAEKGLPASMEEKILRKALEVPVLSIKRDETSALNLVESESTETPNIPTTSTDTQDTQDSQATTISNQSTAASSLDAPTAATSFSEETLNTASQWPNTSLSAPEGIVDLLRLRVAFDFICSNYITPHLTEKLNKLLGSTSTPDFGPLDTHLAHLAKLRKEALAARSLGDYSRKRSLNEDDEEIESRAEKKRKTEEEEKRKKAGESLGVKRLKKANISGMKKMSDFFKKK